MPNKKLDKKTNQKTVHTSQEVKEKMLQLYDELFLHDGYGELKVEEMRLLRRKQKEIIIHCGKEYRYVVDYKEEPG
jgi:hypothetical protein